jgi:hypothetical protein
MLKASKAARRSGVLWYERRSLRRSPFVFSTSCKADAHGMQAWTRWQLAADRGVLELQENLMPAGGALKLELLDAGGVATSYGLWRFSETGQVLAVVHAGAA